MKVLRSTIKLATFAAALAMMTPSNASALESYWGPRVYPPNALFKDYPEYHSWAFVIAGASDGTYSQAVQSICAAAETEANNIRSGSGCNYGVADRGSILSSRTPYSRGYVYYYDSYFAVYLAGHSGTDL